MEEQLEESLEAIFWDFYMHFCTELASYDDAEDRYYPIMCGLAEDYESYTGILFLDFIDYARCIN